MSQEHEQNLVERNSAQAALIQGNKLAEPNLAALNILRLAELFPDCVIREYQPWKVGAQDQTHNVPMLKVDVPRLLSNLGLKLDASPKWEQATTITDWLSAADKQEGMLDLAQGERYQLDWPGKQAARQRALAPVHKTLQVDLERSLDFEHTGNLFLTGDNLDALKLLQLSFLGSVKVIYIDPPYNTGNDSLVYHDNFRQLQASGEAEDALCLTAQVSGNGKGAGVSKGEVRLSDDLVISVNQGSDGRLHSNWCSMMYERMLLARPLLSEDGAIFVSIDDREVTNLRKIMDEVFGESNFVITFVWKKKQGGGNDTGLVVNDHEYILVYAKDITKVDLGLDFGAEPNLKGYPFSDELGHYNLITLDKSSIRFSPSLCFDIVGPDGQVYRPRVIKGKQSCWRWSKDKVAKQYDELVFKDGNVYTKNYLKDGKKPRSLLIEAERFGRTNQGKNDLQELFTNCPFSYPKPVRLISYLISLMQGNDFTVLDFFAGSATTAQAVMECNLKDGGSRHFITIQLPEPIDSSTQEVVAADVVQHNFATLSDLAIERIRRAALKVGSKLSCTKIVRGGGVRILSAINPMIMRF